MFRRYIADIPNSWRIISRNLIAYTWPHDCTCANLKVVSSKYLRQVLSIPQCRQTIMLRKWFHVTVRDRGDDWMIVIYADVLCHNISTDTLEFKTETRNEWSNLCDCYRCAISDSQYSMFPVWATARCSSQRVCACFFLLTEAFELLVQFVFTRSRLLIGLCDVHQLVLWTSTRQVWPLQSVGRLFVLAAFQSERKSICSLLRPTFKWPDFIISLLEKLHERIFSLLLPCA